MYSLEDEDEWQRMKDVECTLKCEIDKKKEEERTILQTVTIKRMPDASETAES